MSDNLKIIIPFAQMDGLGQHNPNLKSSDAKNRYFDCMKVAFSTARFHNPHADLIIVTNKNIPSNYEDFFRRLGVRVVDVPFRHMPPEGYMKSFQASLYFLDALGTVDTSPTLILDPDVVVVRNLDEFVDSLDGRCAAYPVSAPPYQKFSGLSRVEAQKVHARIDGASGLPLHFGGECYVLQGPETEAIKQRAELAWEAALSDYRSNDQPRFLTEEHMMNYALNGSSVSLMDHVIKRIWTAHSYRNTGPEDPYLHIWHLPAEKDKGFARMASTVEDFDSWFWSTEDDEWRDRLAREFSLGRRSPWRLAVDLVAHVRREVRDMSGDPFERAMG